MSPELAIIIPHYNDPVRLALCLEALAPQIRAAGAAVEAVVVDNDSPVSLSDLAAAQPWARFVTEPQKGAAMARNRGVAETVAPKIVFLDSDCIPSDSWLETARDLARGMAPTGALLGGRVDTFDETPPPRSGAEAFEAVFAFHQKTYIEKKGFSVTANLLTTRAVFEDVGPLVAGLSEDVDWCWRAVSKGYPLIYADDLVVRHPTRQDWAALTRKWRRTTEEGFHLNGRSVPARLRWLLRAGVVGLSAPAHIPRVLRHAALSGLEKRRAVMTLIRLRGLRAWWMLGQALTG